MALNNEDGLGPQTRAAIDAQVRTNLVSTRAAIAAVKATTAAGVAGGIGLNNAQTIALDAQVDAITTALNNSGLPKA